MANWFVRKSGSDSNAGTSAVAAWLTVQKSLTLANGVVGGDNIYVGAGLYRESITITLAPGSVVNVYADLDGVLTGDAGPVRIDGATSDFADTAAHPAIKLNGKSNFLFQGFELLGGGTGSNSHCIDGTAVTSSTNITVRKCAFLSSQGASTNGNGISLTCAADTNSNILIDQCVFAILEGANAINIFLTKSAVSDYDAGITIQNCTFTTPSDVIQVQSVGASTFLGGGVRVFNNGCPISGSRFLRVNAGVSSTFPCVAYGNYVHGNPVFAAVGATGQVIEDYNVCFGTNSLRSNVPIGANSIVGASVTGSAYLGQAIVETRNQRPYGMPDKYSLALGMGCVSGNTLPPGTAADDATVGTISWTTPANAKQSDGTSTTNVVTASATSHYLKCTNFGFAIPGGATIIGVMVDVQRSLSAGTGVVKDNLVKLVKTGTISGTDHSSTTAYPASLTWQSYGNQAGGDLWGLALTPTDVNDSTFGCAISCKETGGAASGTASIDCVRITIFYTSQITTDIIGVTRPVGCSVFAAEGTATSGAAKTLTDTGATFPGSNALADYQVKIKSGTGSGQVKVIRTNTLTVLTVDGNWVTNPDSTSVYVVYRGPMATSGKFTSGSTTTGTDSNAAWAVNQWTGFVCQITAGTGSGQIAGIASNTATALTFQGSATAGIPVLGTALDSTSVYAIYKAPGTSVISVNDTPGPIPQGNTGISNTAVVRTGTKSLRLFGPSYHDLSLPVDASSTTVTIYAQYDSEYAGTLPQIQVLNGSECGVSNATATHTGAVNTWQALALTFTPTSKGIVTIRLLNNSTTPTGSAYFDA